MYIARKNASTVDERSKGIDSQDPFATSEIPVAGAIVNPLVGSVTSQVAGNTVAELNTTTVGYGAFGGNDLTDHYKFTAKKDTVYSLIVSTDSSNGNIRTEAYADYFDIYFEDATGARVTADFQIKELDLYTKLVEYKAPADGTYYVQVDNAFEKPFEYAIALYDKSLAPQIAVSSKALEGGLFQVTFTSHIDLSTTRPRVDRIEVAGGTLGTLTRGADGKSYTAVFTPKADSTAEPTVKVLNGAFFSKAGDLNLDGEEANNFVRVKQAAPVDPGTGSGAGGGTGGGTGGNNGGGTGGSTGGNPPADTTAPAVTTISVSDTALGPNSKPTVTFTFSEAVTGFDAKDVTVTGGTLSAFAGSGSTYTATLEVNADNQQQGLVKLVVGKDYKDAANNSATTTFTKDVQFDITAPTVQITSAKDKVRPGDTVVVTIKFSEPVREFGLDAIVVAGGVAANLRSASADDKTFEVDVTADASGDGTDPIGITLDGSKILDRVGNVLAAPKGLSVALDLTGLRVLELATVDALTPENVNFVVSHSEGLPVSFYIADGAGALALEGAQGVEAAAVSSLTFTPQTAAVSGELRVTDGKLDAGGIPLAAEGQTSFVDLSLGLVVVLGTDSVSSGGSGSDSLSVVTDLPSALYGFGGDDTLIEGANTVLMNGGDGIDTFELTPGQGATLIVDTGSPTSIDALFGLFGLVQNYTGFDLITGFDVGTDTFRFAGKTYAQHKTIVGTYDTTLLVFTPDAKGSDVMVYLDGEAGTANQFDEGELAVVIVGAASAVNTPAIGGPGE